MIHLRHLFIKPSLIALLVGTVFTQIAASRTVPEQNVSDLACFIQKQTYLPLLSHAEADPETRLFPAQPTWTPVEITDTEEQNRDRVYPGANQDIAIGNNESSLNENERQVLINRFRSSFIQKCEAAARKSVWALDRQVQWFQGYDWKVLFRGEVFVKGRLIPQKPRAWILDIKDVANEHENFFASVYGHALRPRKAIRSLIDVGSSLNTRPIQWNFGQFSRFWEAAFNKGLGGKDIRLESRPSPQGESLIWMNISSLEDHDESGRRRTLTYEDVIANIEEQGEESSITIDTDVYDPETGKRQETVRGTSVESPMRLKVTQGSLTIQTSKTLRVAMHHDYIEIHRATSGAEVPELTFRIPIQRNNGKTSDVTYNIRPLGWSPASLAGSFVGYQAKLHYENLYESALYEHNKFLKDIRTTNDQITKANKRSKSQQQLLPEPEFIAPTMVETCPQDGCGVSVEGSFTLHIFGEPFTLSRQKTKVNILRHTLQKETMNYAFDVFHQHIPSHNLEAAPSSHIDETFHMKLVVPFGTDVRRGKSYGMHLRNNIESMNVQISAEKGLRFDNTPDRQFTIVRFVSPRQQKDLPLMDLLAVPASTKIRLEANEGPVATYSFATQNIYFLHDEFVLHKKRKLSEPPLQENLKNIQTFLKRLLFLTSSFEFYYQSLEGHLWPQHAFIAKPSGESLPKNKGEAILGKAYLPGLLLLLPNAKHGHPDIDKGTEERQALTEYINHAVRVENIGGGMRFEKN